MVGLERQDPRMLDRTHRFHGLGSLRYVYTRGETLRGLAVALKYIRNSRRTDWRVAVVVSRKVHKSAVVRNRIRRRIYEVLREQAGNITEPFDMVFIVYNDQLAALPTEELQVLILGQLRSAGIVENAG